MTPSEREAREAVCEAVKQALMLADLAYRGQGGEMRAHMAYGSVITRQQLHALEHYIGKAILDAARARVEAKRKPELPDTVPQRDEQGDHIGFLCTVCNEDESDCRCEDKRDAYHEGIDAALAALTDTEGT